MRRQDLYQTAYRVLNQRTQRTVPCVPFCDFEIKNRAKRIGRVWVIILNKCKKIAEDSTQGSPGIHSRTSATISISKLLDIVNDSYSDMCQHIEPSPVSLEHIDFWIIL